MKRELEISDRLRGNPHLLPIFSSTLSIPERLKEYDDNLFVVLNAERQWYEVHSLDNKGDTFCFVVPLNELDARVLYIARKNNIRVHGKKVLDEITEHNRKLEESNKKKRTEEIRLAAREMRPYIKKMAYGY